MPRIAIVGQGTLQTVGQPTLRKLETGETFRFLNSAPDKIYQKVEISERDEDWDATRTEYTYLYSDVLTGRLYGDVDDSVVVPVTCSMTVSEKTK